MKRLAVLAGVVGLALGAVGGAVAVSVLNPGVDDSAISNTSKEILVTAPVVLKPVREHYEVSGLVEGPSAVALVLRSSGVDIVTAHPKESGDTLSYGSLVAVVSGRPVVALPVWVPLYRDLLRGDTGEDVRALEQALIDLGLMSGSPTGVFDGSTVQAARGLFRPHGYDLPNQEILPLSWTVGLESSPVRVVEALSVGKAVDGEHPVATIGIGATTVKARVDMLQSRAFTQDTSVDVSITAGPSFSGVVVSVSEFQEAGTNQPAGYDVVFSVPDDAAADLVTGMSARVTDTATVEQGLAVPLTAVRSDDAGAYVLVAGQSRATEETPEASETPGPSETPSASDTPGSSETPSASVTPGVSETPGASGTPGLSETPGSSESVSPSVSVSDLVRVDVDVLGNASGYAIVKENPALPVGTLVVVSGG